MEDIKRGMADDDSERGGIFLDQASTRLSEARRLMERGRAGDLDHESLGEIRRVLGGMKHDASEGHRLLRQAYEQDGEIGPMARLNSFAQAHRGTWNGLRDRLPVQLTDVGNEVEGVFVAIDEEVEPLQGMLPRTPEKGAVGTSTPGSPQNTSRTQTQRPPSSPAAPSTGGEGSTRPQPSGSGSGSLESDGLLGGNTGGLLDTPPAGIPTAPSVGPSTPEMPDVTIPPLLPGLLPGLGIDSEDAR